MATIQNVLSEVDETKLNGYSETAKTAWINTVEGMVKDKILQTFGYFGISRIKEQPAYDLPAGVNFLKLVKGFMDGTEIEKLDLRALNKRGYFLDSAGKLNIYPVPSQDDPVGSPGLRFIFKEAHVKYVYDQDKDTELLVPAPYDNIYTDYCYAQIDWFNREYKSYNNTMARYNASWRDAERNVKQNGPVNPSQMHNLW